MFCEIAFGSDFNDDGLLSHNTHTKVELSRHVQNVYTRSLLPGAPFTNMD